MSAKMPPRINARMVSLQRYLGYYLQKSLNRGQTSFDARSGGGAPDRRKHAGEWTGNSYPGAARRQSSGPGARSRPTGSLQGIGREDNPGIYRAGSKTLGLMEVFGPLEQSFLNKPTCLFARLRGPPVWPRNYDVTRTSTDISAKAPVDPTNTPETGMARRISRTTATGIRLKPPTLRFVGSNVIQPAPGT